MDALSGNPTSESNNVALSSPSSADYVDLHELAKGWKASIARAKDPATK